VNFTILKKYIDDGLVVKQDHPTLPLSIYNYSRTCQYDKLWDDITLQCRGLVLDGENNVIAKPFPKFFNMEELSDSEIPNESFEAFEKMDGSLGICFYYESEWHIATRGSFTSEQAIRGRELLNKYNYKNGLISGYTYLFEIIYPENRIVVNYGDYEGLVVLAAYHNETGREVSIDEMDNEGFDVVKKYDGVNDFTKLKGIISNDAEGYVIRFKSGMRMKIKGDEYVRLHRILTNFSTTDIWELLKTKGNLNEFLERVPDEFDTWVKETVKDLMIRYENIEKDYFEIFSNLKSQGLNRKEFAIKAIHYRHPSVLFYMLDGKNYSDIIWKIIKPKWSKPFRKDIDN
jgi:RNA ligase